MMKRKEKDVTKTWNIHVNPYTIGIHHKQYIEQHHVPQVLFLAYTLHIVNASFISTTVVSLNFYLKCNSCVL